MEDKIKKKGKMNTQAVKSAVGKILVIIIITSITIGLFFYENPQFLPSQSQSLHIPKNYYYHLNIPSQGQRVVCIVFDDGWQNQFDTAIPTLNYYGFKAIFGIITSYANRSNSNYVNWSEIITLAKNGMDIESHTYSHLNLNQQDDASIIYQLTQSKKDLLDHGVNSSILIYPEGGGAGNSTVESLVQQYYLVARGITDAQLDLSSPFDRFDLPAYTMSHTTTVSQFEKIVNNAGNSTIVILYYHKISDENVDTATSPQIFSTEMQYLHDNNFDVMTLSQLFLKET